MSSSPHCGINPFDSPAPVTTSDIQTRRPDVLATADLFLEQLKELEDLCSTVEERVQRKRQALKELEYLISGLNSDGPSPYSPACPTNTPINSRIGFVSPRLRGLFDLHGPGRMNLDAMQSCLDYSPEGQANSPSMQKDPARSEEWIDDNDDDKQALLSPFDDKYALDQSLPKVEKELPAVPQKTHGILESKIPRKAHARRQISTRKTTRSVTVSRSNSRARRPSLRSVKVTETSSDSTANLKATMRRGSWKRSIENAKKGGSKGSTTGENECTKDGTRKKGKKKGLWSIYSVCSDFGPNNGTQHYYAI